MNELPLPNLDEIPDKPAPKPPEQPASPTKLPGLPFPSLKAPKLPTIQRPDIKLPRIPWRVVLTTLGVVLVIGIASFFLFFWKATITITTAPADAQILLDDQAATGALKAVLRPTTYHVAVSRQDFIPYQTNITLKIHERRALAIALRAMPAPMELSDKAIQFMALNPEGTALVFVAPSQKTAYKLFTKDLTKPVIDEITPPDLAGITNFIWSPNRELAFMKLHEVTKQYDFNRYDLVNQKVHDWPEGVGSIDWRPDGEKVAYDYEPTGGERTIIRATKDNGEQERIFNLVGTAIDHPTLHWSPDSKHIAVVTTELHVLDAFSKELTAFDALGPIKQAAWLPTSTGLIVQGQDDQLSFVTLAGAVTKLGVTGSIDQVVPFADGTAIVYTRERNSKTEFYRLELVTQTLTPYLFRSQAPLAPTNLILSKNEQTLFFVSGGHPTALTLDSGQY